MSPQAASRSRAAASAQRPASSSASTREMLVELAAEVFANEGYASASVRDLGRRAGVTSGAIYGNFRGKADLLAEAVDARLTADMWNLPQDVSSGSMVDMVGWQFEHSPNRKQLVALLLEGATAARTDPEVRRRLKEPVARRINDGIAAFEARRAAEGYGAAADLDAVVKMLWAIEIGLQVLAGLGISAPSPQDGADVIRGFLSGLQGGSSNGRRGPRAQSAPAKKPAAAKSGATKSAAKKATKAGSAASPVARKAAPRSAAKAAKKASPRKRAR